MGCHRPTLVRSEAIALRVRFLWAFSRVPSAKPSRTCGKLAARFFDFRDELKINAVILFKLDQHLATSSDEGQAIREFPRPISASTSPLGGTRDHVAVLQPQQMIVTFGSRICRRTLIALQRIDGRIEDHGADTILRARKNRPTSLERICTPVIIDLPDITDQPGTIDQDDLRALGRCRATRPRTTKCLTATWRTSSSDRTTTSQPGSIRSSDAGKLESSRDQL
jgi:hypothetical protein